MDTYRDTASRPTGGRPGAAAVNVGLGIVFALGIVFTAYMIGDSWGGAYWVCDAAVGVVVCSLALLRERQRAGTAIAGLAVAAAAVAVSAAADLPQEPGPVTALALSVLIGSALRALPPGQSAGIAAAGLAVVVGAWFSGSSAVAASATRAWIAAVAVGPGLRALDRGRRLPSP